MRNMRSRYIYILTALCMLAACAALSRLELEQKSARVHQHKEKEWQPSKSLKENSSSTHLPIVKLETKGKKVPGTPIVKNSKIAGYETAENGDSTVQADISVIDGGHGKNNPTDEPEMKSKAQIRYRGNSSRFFDKKSYSIHLVKKDGTEKQEKMAGMNSHNEWVLNGPFLDRTLVRNYLCLNVAGEIMEYAPNVRYCELYLNGEYQGLYLLMESVSRGKKRINIPKPEKNRDVTSYIVRWDRTGKGDHELKNYTFYTLKNDVSSLDVRYPGNRQITKKRLQYIEEDISKIEKVLYSYDLTDEQKGAAKYIDYNSFAEYFVINEFFRNVDAGRFSTFYYKDARGKLKACVWDFNNAGDNYIDYVWNASGFTMQDAPWFGTLLKDERFVNAVVAKYHKLRKGVLSESYLTFYVDETVSWLGAEVEKNYGKWGYVFDLSRYNGMNYLSPPSRNDTSYEKSVTRLKRFIRERGEWMDQHIETLYQYCHSSKNVNELTR